MTRRILMIAYHYPPAAGSSGIQRTVKFVRYLPDFGWLPVVLAPHQRVYPFVTRKAAPPIHEQVLETRSFALDTAKHMAVFGKYPSLLDLPDRWVSWWIGAVPAGLRLIKKLRPCAIWSTYPIATAHLIGLTLSRLSGLPWVADFRDPMVEPGYPPDPRKRSVYGWIENKTMRACAAAVFTTRGTLREYRARFPDLDPARFRLIENGFDEDDFGDDAGPVVPRANPDRRLLLLHSGTLYPTERDPSALFQAVAQLLGARAIDASRLHIVLRATYHDKTISGLIDRFDVGSIFEIAPPIGYREALSEMTSADGLLILQAGNCNNQIPAKLYEYLRAGRPILALTDEHGDTAKALREAGIDTIAQIDSVEEIKQALLGFLRLVREDRAPIVATSRVESYSRRSRTREMAAVLDALC